MNSAAGVVFKSLSEEWSTDSRVYDSLNREFNFNFDPCPLGGDIDGLATLFLSWEGKRAWINPPYGRHIGKWIRRAHETELAVFLLPARTDTEWFHFCLEHATEIRFVRRRLKFGNAVNPAPFPSVIIVFDNRRPCPALIAS